MFNQSISLGENLYLQASRERFRVHRLAPWDPAPLDALSELGDPASTRQLMAGAVFAGLPAIPSSQAPRDPLLSHIHGLASAYRTTGSTPSTELKAAERLAARGQHDAAAYRRHVAEEETGHDVLAMLDMTALGLPVETFVARLQPPTALALSARQQALALSDEPIAVVGYAYALERFSLFVTAEVIAATERALPPGVNATRCLRVHSAVGGDAGHVAESLDFIAGLPARDRLIIAREAYQTACLMHAADDYPGDQAMRDLLASLDWPHLRLVAA
jgi:hypothetical protein